MKAVAVYLCPLAVGLRLVSGSFCFNLVDGIGDCQASREIIFVKNNKEFGKRHLDGAVINEQVTALIACDEPVVKFSGWGMSVSAYCLKIDGECSWTKLSSLNRSVKRKRADMVLLTSKPLTDAQQIIRSWKHLKESLMATGTSAAFTQLDQGRTVFRELRNTPEASRVFAVHFFGPFQRAGNRIPAGPSGVQYMLDSNVQLYMASDMIAMYRLKLDEVAKNFAPATLCRDKGWLPSALAKFHYFATAHASKNGESIIVHLYGTVSVTLHFHGNSPNLMSEPSKDATSYSILKRSIKGISGILLTLEEGQSRSAKTLAEAESVTKLHVGGALHSSPTKSAGGCGQ